MSGFFAVCFLYCRGGFIGDFFFLNPSLKKIFVHRLHCLFHRILYGYILLYRNHILFIIMIFGGDFHNKMGIMFEKQNILNELLIV